MKYRTFKKINEKVSLLGMGAMRLPETADGKIDEAEAIDMIRSSIDSGVTYVDTAYNYHGGNSEVIVGKALQDGYREKVLLADKMPIWLAKDEDGMRKIFDTQLERLGMDCIDMYLFHSVNASNWKRGGKLNLLPFLDELKAAGKVRYVGFSFHDSYELFEEVIDAYPWDFCQIQLNYVDKDAQAGLKGLKLAAEKGLGVIIMEPLKGGKLTAGIPPTVQELWDSAPAKRTPAEWGFKWLARLPEVTLILSGMSSRQQLEENIRILSTDDLEDMSDAELKLLDSVAAEYNRLIKYPCTGCEYCLPCPQKLKIPDLIEYYNDWNTYGNNPATRTEYIEWVAEGRHASNCIACGSCEEKCPQQLPIIQALKDAAAAFGV